MKKLKLLFCAFVSLAMRAQYAPPAGMAGSTAIHEDSPVFVNWANRCSVSRGYQDISNTGMGKASAGDSTLATGKANTNGVVSLGDGGSAICTCPFVITNGEGPDFAVFENGFGDEFLELAFVEVSSDGLNFTRFAAHSLSDTLQQTESFDSTDARKINNLAGKYRSGYGTPFDLEELKGTPGLNVNAVTHVKVIDVIGSLRREFCSRDSYGNKINDPWPTPFPQSGFDFDAIGVINQLPITGVEENVLHGLKLYPNPARSGEEVTIQNHHFLKAELFAVTGKLVKTCNGRQLNTDGLQPGIYFLKTIGSESVYILKLIIY